MHFFRVYPKVPRQTILEYILYLCFFEMVLHVFLRLQINVPYQSVTRSLLFQLAIRNEMVQKQIPAHRTNITVINTGSMGLDSRMTLNFFALCYFMENGFDPYEKTEIEVYTQLQLHAFYA